MIETASFEGELYAAPFNTNTQLLWYRKDLVTKPPKTWDEMIDEAEELKEAGTIQVQAEPLRGLHGLGQRADRERRHRRSSPAPKTVDLEQEPTEKALEVMGRLANSSAAPPSLSTSDEDSARLGFEAGESAFMTNYTFAYASAQAEAPEIGKEMGFAPLPAGRRGTPSKPPLGGFNLAVSSYSEQQGRRLRRGRLPGRRKEPADRGRTRRPAALALGPLHRQSRDRRPTPASPAWSRNRSRTAGPRPTTPAYQDVSLGGPAHPAPAGQDRPRRHRSSIYDELKSNLEDAVKREGLL